MRTLLIVLTVVEIVIVVGALALYLMAPTGSRTIIEATTMGTEQSPELVPRRYLEAFLLLTLRRDGSSHGYELCETVRAHGLSVDLAGVYRSLRSMDRRDLLSATWEPSENGPDRRIYELTEAGVVAAADAADELIGLRDVLTDALDAFGVPLVGRPA